MAPRRRAARAAAALAALWPLLAAAPRHRGPAAVAPACAARRGALAAAAAAAGGRAAPARAEGAGSRAPELDSEVVAKALGAFAAGDYAASEAAWRRAAEELPESAYAWSSLGTCLLIRAQDYIQLDRPLTPEASRLLEEALGCLDRAIGLSRALARDPIVLNQRANVFNLQRRWGEAVDAYKVAVSVSPPGLASIPRQNLALAYFELGDDRSAEREAAGLILRDPEFIDARALLAAIRWSVGDASLAETSWSEICEGVKAPEDQRLLAKAVNGLGQALGVSAKYVPRAGGPEFCRAYGTLDGVRGRWPPRALAAYEAFLARRPPAAAGGGGAASEP